MITKFSPLWNQFLEGLVNHDAGNGSYNGLSPKWNNLHPGRAWALEVQAARGNAERHTE
ncbi:Eco29kI family restriction endonuclease [Ottowia thiooxydans]|uniref:Eco29kI family restriction endonuclease n=1 Tax=Ottowia thiooxydans TaxID=219182 RepID=UPI001FE080A5|nr:Eco29kI family restriction endonuclease [Ottowia thiooxydans]